MSTSEDPKSAWSGMFAPGEERELDLRDLAGLVSRLLLLEAAAGWQDDMRVAQGIQERASARARVIREGAAVPAAPTEQELRKLHDLITDLSAVIDLEEHKGLWDRCMSVLRPCDDAGHCPTLPVAAPLAGEAEEPKPPSADDVLACRCLRHATIPPTIMPPATQECGLCMREEGILVGRAERQGWISGDMACGGRRPDWCDVHQHRREQCGAYLGKPEPAPEPTLITDHTFLSHYYNLDMCGHFIAASGYCRARREAHKAPSAAKEPR